MKDQTEHKREEFKIKWDDWDNFSDFLHNVLPTESNVECIHADETKVRVSLPKSKSWIFSKIRACSMLL